MPYLSCRISWVCKIEVYAGMLLSVLALAGCSGTTVTDPASTGLVGAMYHLQHGTYQKQVDNKRQQLNALQQQQQAQQDKQALLEQQTGEQQQVLSQQQRKLQSLHAAEQQQDHSRQQAVKQYHQTQAQRATLERELRQVTQKLAIAKRQGQQQTGVLHALEQRRSALRQELVLLVQMEH